MQSNLQWIIHLLVRPMAIQFWDNYQSQLLTNVEKSRTTEPSASSRQSFPSLLYANMPRRRNLSPDLPSSCLVDFNWSTAIQRLGMWKKDQTYGYKFFSISRRHSRRREMFISQYTLSNDVESITNWSHSWLRRAGKWQLSSNPIDFVLLEDTNPIDERTSQM